MAEPGPSSAIGWKSGDFETHALVVFRGCISTGTLLLFFLYSVRRLSVQVCVSVVAI